jgi:hypothetical protein
MCKHLWFFAVFGHIIIRKCQFCGRTEMRSHPDEEWVRVDG